MKLWQPFVPDPPFQRGLRATGLLDNKSISVYVVHLAAPNMLTYPRDQFASIASEHYTSRRAQITYLRDEIAKRTLVTFLLCDCNMSDASWTYAVLNEVMHDTFVERGWDLGFTLMAPLTILTQRYHFVWHTAAPTTYPSLPPFKLRRGTL